MSERREASSIRAEIERLPKRGRGRRYPTALRTRVLSYLQSRSQEGVSAKGVGDEIGLSVWTLSRWQKESPTPPTPNFERVELVVEPAARSRLVVYGPAGLRIEGLDLADLAELVRRVQ